MLALALLAVPAVGSTLQKAAPRAPRPGCTPQFAPLDTGASTGGSDLEFWRTEEAGKWGGTGWLGWAWDDATIRAVRMTVRKRPKEFPEEDWVSVEASPKVTFAVRCIPQIRPGKIQSVRMANHELDFDGPLDISLGARHYTVRLESTDPSFVDGTVVLAEGRRTQILYTTGGSADEPHFTVVWAGDVDRDGKLDLIVNLSRKYSWHPYQLLLSTKARGQDLVGEAAVFVTGD